MINEHDVQVCQQVGFFFKLYVNLFYDDYASSLVFNLMVNVTYVMIL